MNSNRQIEVSARFKIISSQGAFDGSHVMSRNISFQDEFMLQSLGVMHKIFRKTLAAELQVIFSALPGAKHPDRKNYYTWLVETEIFSL